LNYIESVLDGEEDRCEKISALEAILGEVLVSAVYGTVLYFCAGTMFIILQACVNYTTITNNKTNAFSTYAIYQYFVFYYSGEYISIVMINYYFKLLLTFYLCISQVPVLIL